MTSTTAPKDIPSAMKKLSISTDGPARANPAPRIPKAKSKATEEVAESWEDDAEEDFDNLDAEGSTAASLTLDPLSRQSTGYNPHPPPPTPASPNQSGFSYSELSSSTRFPAISKTTSAAPSPPRPATPTRSRGHSTATSGTTTPEKRPDKTTVAASRLIAAGLGMKAPKRTESEREYDKVSREAERRKKERAREEAKRKEEEEQKAKEAVWDD